MNVFEPIGSAADRMALLRTHENHVPGGREPLEAEQAGTGFRDSLMGSLDAVNEGQISHEQLSVKAIIDPESVDPHDLTIAAAKATTSLSITRNVVDRVIQAYRDITNLR